MMKYKEIKEKITTHCENLVLFSNDPDKKRLYDFGYRTVDRIMYEIMMIGCDTFILEPIDGEKYTKKMFISKDAVLKYMDEVYQKENGEDILDSYYLVFEKIYGQSYDEEIEESEESAIPALGFYRANRDIKEV